MRSVVFILILLGNLSVLSLTAQDASLSRHRVSIEIGGLGLVYSLNYHHAFAEGWEVRAGFGGLGVQERQTGKQLKLLVLPVDVRRNFDFNNHQVGIGFGIQNILGISDLVSFEEEVDLFLNPAMIISYNYRIKPHLMIGANFTPFYGTKSLTNEGGFFALYDRLVINGTTIHLWGSLAVSYQF